MGDFDRAPGAIPLPCQFAQRIGEGEEHGGTAVGVGGAKFPGVVVAADDDPLVWKFTAGKGSDHVFHPHHAPGLLHFQADGQLGPAFEAVGEGKPPLPGLGHSRPAHPAQDFLGGTVPDGGDRDAVQAFYFLGLQAVYFFCPIYREGGFKGRQRVACVVEREQGAALYGALVEHFALRIHQSAHVAGILRVGVDDQPYRSCRLGKLGFIAPEVAPVARNNDFPFDGNAQFGQLFEIFFGPVVGVHDFGSMVAATGIGVPAVLRVRVGGERVAFYDVFFDVERLADRRHQFQRYLAFIQWHV